ncbi:MAG: FAD-dependent oxidoreductase, partial [Actinomycetota bacterium]|nr:FAD-dependent oxidoreductase [Actinomycetota bacterium]
MAHSFVIIGGGPAGNQAATYAARLGAQVTMIEREIVGGAAHLLDCIPSKTMIATGGAISFGQRIGGMGLADASTTVDEDALVRRVGSIRDHMQHDTTELLESQGVRIIRGTARFTSPHSVEVDTTEGVQQIDFDSALIATGTRPRIPEWCN